MFLSLNLSLSNHYIIDGERLKIVIDGHLIKISSEPCPALKPYDVISSAFHVVKSILAVLYQVTALEAHTSHHVRNCQGILDLQTMKGQSKEKENFHDGKAKFAVQREFAR